jgi:rhodanese-related sulfurtransferase
VLFAVATVCGLTANAVSSGRIPLVTAAPPSAPRHLSLSQTVDAIDRGDVVVDTRNAASYAAGHVAGAVNVPYAQRVARLADMRTIAAYRKPIVVYCRGGDCKTADRFADWLLQEGWSDVAVFDGGYPVWEAAGLEIERGATE